MPSVSFQGSTTTTMTFEVIGYVDWGIYSGIRWELLDESYDLVDFAETGSTEHTFYSLNPNSWYYCTVGGIIDGATDPWGNASGWTDSARPSNFSWTTAKVSGQNFNLTASEWNSFTSRILEFRTYKGLGSYSFTSAVSGNTFTAVMFNQARNSIYDMNTSVMGTVSAGQDVLASYLNDLVSSLNAIS